MNYKTGSSKDVVNTGTQLKRAIGFWQLVMIGLGGVIGSGWLLGAMYAAKAAGPASIISWIIGGLFFLVIALIFAELGMVKSEAGALVRYPFYSNGAFLAAMVGWGIWAGHLTNPPLEATAVTQYISSVIPGLYAGNVLSGFGVLTAMGFMALFVLVNYFGVKLFAITNQWVTTIKFIVPVITIIALFSTGLQGGNNFSNASYGGFAPYGYAPALGAIATAGLVFAYTGFRNILNMSGETKNPKKTIPRALITVILISMALYILLEVAFIGALPGGNLIHGWHGINLTSPFAQLALAINFSWLYTIILADSVYSPAGSSLVYTAGNARMVHALSNNRFLPKFIGKIDSKWAIPRRALILNYFLGLLLLIPLKSWIAIISLLGTMGVYTLSYAAVPLLVFRKSGITQDDSKLKAMEILAPIGFVLGTLIIYWAGFPHLYLGSIIMLIGVFYYLITFAFRKEKPKHFREGIWFAVYIVFVLGFSYIGSFHGLGIVPSPYDSIVVAIVSLGIMYWGVKSGISYVKANDIKELMNLEPMPLLD
ncbi:MAG: APC family permease [Thermoplasmatales archaeon]|nr:APC family permease [Thermoplasmatales archaeon]